MHADPAPRSEPVAGGSIWSNRSMHECILGKEPMICLMLLTASRTEEACKAMSTGSKWVHLRSRPTTRTNRHLTPAMKLHALALDMPLDLLTYYRQDRLQPQVGDSRYHWSSKGALCPVCVIWPQMCAQGEACIHVHCVLTSNVEFLQR